MEHVSALLYTCQHYWTRVTCSLVSSTAGALPGSVAVTSGVLEPGPVSATTTSLSLESGVWSHSPSVCCFLCFVLKLYSIIYCSKYKGRRVSLAV